MNKPHKHAELIKAWADGAEIEARYIDDCDAIWVDFQGDWDIEWLEYRIKPTPKPDKVKYGLVLNSLEYVRIHFCRNHLSNIKIVFDGETGEPKYAQVLK